MDQYETSNTANVVHTFIRYVQCVTLVNLLETAEIVLTFAQHKDKLSYKIMNGFYNLCLNYHCHIVKAEEKKEFVNQILRSKMKTYFMENPPNSSKYEYNHFLQKTCPRDCIEDFSYQL